MSGVTGSMNPYTVILISEERVEIVHTSAPDAEHAPACAYVNFIRRWVEARADQPRRRMPSMPTPPARPGGFPIARAAAVFEGHIDGATPIPMMKKMSVEVSIT